MATKAKSKMAFGVATVMAQQNAFEARWLTFRRKLRGCIRELSFDGHKVRGCYIFPERRDGRRVLRRGDGFPWGGGGGGFFPTARGTQGKKAQYPAGLPSDTTPPPPEAAVVAPAVISL